MTSLCADVYVHIDMDSFFYNCCLKPAKDVCVQRMVGKELTGIG